MYLIKSFFNKSTEVWRAFREEGVWTGFVKLGQMIARLTYAHSIHIIFAYHFRDPMSPPSLQPNLVIRQITMPDEITRLSEEVGLSDHRSNCIEWLHQVFNQDSIGFILCQDGHPVGCAWIAKYISPDLFRL